MKRVCSEGDKQMSKEGQSQGMERVLLTSLMTSSLWAIFLIEKIQSPQVLRYLLNSEHILLNGRSSLFSFFLTKFSKYFNPYFFIALTFDLHSEMLTLTNTFIRQNLSNKLSEFMIFWNSLLILNGIKS